MSWRFEPTRDLTNEEITRMFKEQMKEISDEAAIALVASGSFIGQFLVQNQGQS